MLRRLVVSVVLCFISTFIATSPASAAQTPTEASSQLADGLYVVRAYFEHRAMVNDLARDYHPWRVVHDKGYLLIGVDRAGLADIRQRGFRIELDEEQTAFYNKANQPLRGQLAGIPGYPCYRTVEETYTTAQSIVTNYPQLATWIDIGDSWNKVNGQGGYDIYALKLTNSATSGDKPVLFNMSSVHAREYTPAELNTRFAEYLVSQYGVDADVTWLLDHHEIHLVLQANPDGRKQAETGLSWRKNANQNYCGATSNSRGADLNRNYPFEWGCCGGSSGSQCSDTYRGPQPASEPETQAIRDYTAQIFLDQREDDVNAAAPDDATGIFMDTHSFSQLVLWPWGFGNTPVPNGAGMTTLGRKLAWFNGYAPQQAIELYITDGTTDDFAYGEYGIAAYTFELGTSFFQDCGTFENTILPDNLDAMVYAAKASRAPYLLGGGPDATSVSLSATVSGDGNPVTVNATFDDSRYNNSNGTEPVQNISAAQVFIDVPPWSTDETPAPITMQAVDGNFNQSVEATTAQIATSGLTAGRHTVFTRARDSAGSWGVVSAEFLYIVDEALAPRITGQVIAADTGQAVPATINAGGQFEASNAGDGSYELLLLPGTYDVTVTPGDSNYGSTTVNGIQANETDVITQDFVLFPFCEVFADDVEGGNQGWSGDGLWAISNELANSPSNAWSDSPGREYPSNRNWSLTSPVFDLSGFDNARIDFAQICDTEATYDFCYVEVSTDGSTWNTLATYDGLNSTWENISLEAPTLAGSATAQIRFRLQADQNVTEDGWHLDDIVIRGGGAACITADADTDGISDAIDNCTLVDNPDQRDSNGDGFGNACDADLDNDGVINFNDLSLLKDQFFQEGDLDGDLDSDGVVNFNDLSKMKDAFFGEPGPAGPIL